jgi:hypothetical protein
MNTETEKEIIDLVVARLQNLPSNKDISIGSSCEFTKDDLIEHVKKDDEVGKKMVAIEIDFLRSMKEGIFYEQNSINNNA